MRMPMTLVAASAVLGTIAACTPPAASVGRAFYEANCAACHGTNGQGGPLAVSLTRPVPDLTTIAARNGGTFDRNAVMSMIDGYYRKEDTNHPMPEFGKVMEGRIVMVESADGTVTPTPEVLVGLADYLSAIQR